MIHDKFCPSDMPWRCQCATIAAIRADEREKAVTSIHDAAWMVLDGEMGNVLAAIDRHNAVDAMWAGE